MRPDQTWKQLFSIIGFVLGFLMTGLLATLFLIFYVAFPFYVFIRFSGFFEWNRPVGRWELLLMTVVLGFTLRNFVVGI